MKYKILIILGIFLIVFLIYKLNINNKSFYFNLMDKKYNYETYDILLSKKIDKYISYSKNDYRVTDVIRDINDNIEINGKKIQNILIKANIISIMIGNNEFYYKINNNDITEIFEYSNSLINDIEILLKLIRKFSKEKIFFIGFYNNDERFDELYTYITLRIKDICSLYDIIYVDRLSIFNKKENINIYKKISKNC